MKWKLLFWVQWKGQTIYDAKESVYIKSHTNWETGKNAHKGRGGEGGKGSVFFFLQTEYNWMSGIMCLFCGQEEKKKMENKLIIIELN